MTKKFKIFSKIRLKRNRKLKKSKGFTLIELLVTISIFVAFLTIVSQSYLNIVRAQRDANETRKTYSDLRSFIDLVNEEMRNGTIDYVCNPDKLQEYQLSSGATLEELLLEKKSDNALSYRTKVDIKDLQRCSFDPSSYAGVNEKNVLRILSKDGNSSTIFKFESSSDSSGNSAGGKIKVLKLVKINNTWSYADGYTPGAEGNDQLGYKELFFRGLTIAKLAFQIYPLKSPQENLENRYQFQPFVVLTLSVNINSEESSFSLNFQTTISSRVYQ